ncbi:VirE protein [Prolixibacteraceae bacterium JC049]|nr:VirE protein [Prolixibacteraceae bacterium JC049]
MTVSREAILSKTHYGLIIYAFILKQYYHNDDTVLSLSGRDCKPTKNPFNENKCSLMISIVGNLAYHTDKDNAIPNGDIFDFAEIHFKKDGEELLQTINKEMNLHIGEDWSFYKNKKQSISDFEEEVIPEQINQPEFSYFSKPISNTTPNRSINLLDLYKRIKGIDFKERTNKLRSIKDVKEARKFKAFNFDYVTFSGTFSNRNDKALIKHSGLLVIDFDHIPNLSQLKNQLLQDEYFDTELLFISPSGDGLKWIISIDLTKVNHQDYFTAVANYINFTYQIEVDQSGKDVSRACFIPHDETVFINPKYLI